MSGEFLAILDPHQNIFPSGGQRVNILHEATTLSDHMSAFNVDLLHPNYLPATSLDASIVRLPLRQDGKQSNISKKVLTPDEVKQLLLDFVCEEINIVMLFLSHISIIEVLEVDDGGVQRIGRADIKRRPLPLPAGIDNVRREECSVTVSFDTLRPSTSPSSQKWEILHVSSPVDRAIQLLSERLGTDTSDHIAREKLKPTIGLALPVPLKEQWSEGRLFTFLPLPLPTGFPVHIHALFALTQARQNLWNGSERGLVKGTRDE